MKVLPGRVLHIENTDERLHVEALWRCYLGRGAVHVLGRVVGHGAVPSHAASPVWHFPLLLKWNGLSSSRKIFFEPLSRRVESRAIKAGRPPAGAASTARSAPVPVPGNERERAGRT